MKCLQLFIVSFINHAIADVQSYVKSYPLELSKHCCADFVKQAEFDSKH